MRAFAIAAAVAAAAALLVASPASAASDVTVSIAGCVFPGGGQATVPAGSTVSFRIGWLARTAGLEAAFLRDLDLTATVDGAAVAGPMSYWGAPAPATVDGADAYRIDWLYPTGTTLGAGDSVTLVWQGVLWHPVTDGFPQAAGGGLAGPGDLLAGHDTCTVTGV